MRVCSKTGCPNLYEGTATRCPAHEQEAKQTHWANTTAYNTRGHRAFRTAVLTRDPICVLCNVAQATVADHYPDSRAELVLAGLNPNDSTRGRGLCKTCHDRETAVNQPAGWNSR